jgi:Ca2+-binding RTX toxin-like protein
VLRGGPGADRIRGGVADDVLLGGPGADRIRGGVGTDTCRSPRQAPGCEN